MATRRSELALTRMRMAKRFVMKAKPWDKTRDTKGWIIEEKFDGIRARWMDQKFYSQTKHVLPVHPEIINLAKLEFGTTEYDMEISCGRGNFQKTSSVVRNTHSTVNQWLGVKFHIFDFIPTDEGTTCAERKEILRGTSFGFGNFQVVPQLGTVMSNGHVDEELKVMEYCDGEGLILRNPDAPYHFGYTKDMYKVKGFIEDEVIVIGYTEGDGHNEGVMGALICRQLDGKKFKVGTGFTDHDRANPPAINSIITIKFFKYTDKGVPRHAVYKGIRDYE